MLAVKAQAKSMQKALKKPGFIPENGLVWGINIPTNIYIIYLRKENIIYILA